MSDPLQTLWAKQQEEPFAMSIADIHVRAASFQSRIRNRNWREHLIAALLVPVFGWIGWIAPDWAVKVGAGLIIAGIIYISIMLSTKARAGTPRDLAAAKSWAAFYREELMRQYTALRDVWRWYLMPLVPGMIVFMAGSAFTADNPAPFFAKAIIFVLLMGVVAAVFFGVYWLNRRGARQLKATIDALDAAQQG